MTINNELSSDIAAAIFTHKKPDQELEQLREIILSVHSTLQKMSEEASRREKQSEHQKVSHQPPSHPRGANNV
jgi:hypothetical protein